jgi:hypothetical protein
MPAQDECCPDHDEHAYGNRRTDSPTRTDGSRIHWARSAAPSPRCRRKASAPRRDRREGCRSGFEWKRRRACHSGYRRDQKRTTAAGTLGLGAGRGGVDADGRRARRANDLERVGHDGLSSEWMLTARGTVG